MSDLAALTIDLGFPESAFLYRATTPKVLIDGVDQQVSGWGRQQIAVAHGPHRLQVYVPYAMPRRAGKAQIEVAAPAHLEYMAPTITFARGALGKPGEQKSAGLSGVWIANIVAVALVVVALVVVLAVR